MQRLARTYICLCVSIWHQCVYVYFHYPCSSAHATDCQCLPSRHRLRICIDIGFACVSASASHHLDLGCAYPWLRLHINSNKPWNPTYLNSANSQIRFDIGFALSWHRLRVRLGFGFALSWPACTNLRLVISTSASHSSWHRLRIIFWNGIALVLTWTSH